MCKNNNRLISDEQKILQTISLQDYNKRLWNHSNTKIPVTIGRGTDTAKPRTKALHAGQKENIISRQLYVWNECLSMVNGTDDHCINLRTRCMIFLSQYTTFLWNEYTTHYYSCLLPNHAAILWPEIISYRSYRPTLAWELPHYHKISNISRTQSETLSDCRFILQLPFANPLKPGVKLRLKM